MFISLILLVMLYSSCHFRCWWPKLNALAAFYFLRSWREERGESIDYKFKTYITVKGLFFQVNFVLLHCGKCDFMIYAFQYFHVFIILARLRDSLKFKMALKKQHKISARLCLSISRTIFFVNFESTVKSRTQIVKDKIKAYFPNVICCSRLWLWVAYLIYFKFTRVLFYLMFLMVVLLN